LRRCAIQIDDLHLFLHRKAFESLPFHGMFLTEEPIALTASSTSTSNTEPTASAPDTELSLPSTADSSNVNTVDVSTPAAIPTEDLVDHHTVRDMKVAGC